MQARRVPYTTYQTVYRTVQHRVPYTVYETSYGAKLFFLFVLYFVRG